MDSKDLECLLLHGGHKWDVTSSFGGSGPGKILVIHRCRYCKKVKTKEKDIKRVLEGLKRQSYILSEEPESESDAADILNKLMREVQSEEED
jgi:hypothetical protein